MKKINKRKLLLRFITLPFISIIFLITIIYNYIIVLWKWLLYGGEILVFEQKENKNIKDIYDLLKDLKANQDKTK